MPELPPRKRLVSRFLSTPRLLQPPKTTHVVGEPGLTRTSNDIWEIAGAETAISQTLIAGLDNWHPLQ